jgi:hypothetical protein
MTLTVFAITPSVVAKTISLYEQPKMESKIIGSIDTTKGVVSIFTSKDGQWVKVGDPLNGNAGWVKSSDLGNGQFTFNMMKLGNGNQSYQVIQYGNVKPLTAAEVAEASKKMQLREEAIQKDMQHMIQDMFVNMHDWEHFPMILPVMMVPVKEAPNKPAK